MAAKKFIQKALNPAHEGALTRKAKAAGESVNAFAEEHRHDPGETGHQSRFYLEVLKHVQRKRKTS